MSYQLRSYRDGEHKNTHWYPVRPSNKVCCEQIEEDDGNYGELATFIHGIETSTRTFHLHGPHKGT